MIKHLYQTVSFIVIGFLTVGLVGLIGGSTSPVKAQSGGDTLATRMPTATAVPPPTSLPAATSASKIWVGRLVSNTLGVTEGNGSIFRVRVEGLIGARIELRSGDYLMFAESGSKAEYGPYTAEFAPVNKGTWIVTVPSLGVSLPVEADGYNLAVIEFVQIPVPEATQTAWPSPTSTPLAGQLWQGRLVAENWGIGAPFARLLVQVVGLSGHPVRLSTAVQEINTATTGQKPDELGPDVVEFTGLTPARYIVEPLGLNSRLEVELKANTETRLEFRPVSPPAAPSPTATATPPPLPPPTVTAAPPTSTPSPTATATPTIVPSPTDTATPAASPTPVTQWLGTVADRTPAGSESSTIIVKVAGIEGLPVQLRATGGGMVGDRRCITGRGTEGQDACAFAGVPPGQYLVVPEGLMVSLPVAVAPAEEVTVLFDIELLPSGVSGWQARLLSNSNGPQAVAARDGTIRVRLAGRAGQVVALRSARGTERFCEVAPNPVLGSLACEFGQLVPGVYLVEAVNTGAGLRLFVDGQGLAEIVFSPSATEAILALGQSVPIVGQGAQPGDRTAVVTPTPVQTSGVTPTPTPEPAPTQLPIPTLIPTATSTPLPSPTFAPTFGWEGRVVETVDLVIGTIGVRAAGLKDHPVFLRSGGWQSEVQFTGSKPELGDYAVEFGGLAQGKYTVVLVDLAEIDVELGPDQFMLVEFRYGPVNLP